MQVCPNARKQPTRDRYGISGIHDCPQSLQFPAYDPAKKELIVEFQEKIMQLGKETYL